MSASDFPYLPAASPASLPPVEDELHRTITAELLEGWNKLMADVERELLGDLDQFRPRGILAALEAPGSLEVAEPAPPFTLTRQFDEALERLYAPIDRRAWETRPEPCDPRSVEPPALPVVHVERWHLPIPGSYDLPPSRWSRPLWAWP